MIFRAPRIGGRDQARVKGVHKHVLKLAVVRGGDLNGELDRNTPCSTPRIRRSSPCSTSKMRCVDVAALFAAAILRRNPESVVVPFDTAAYEAKVDPQGGRAAATAVLPHRAEIDRDIAETEPMATPDTILSLAERLAKYGGGGTDCSLPLVQANGKYAKRRFAGVVLVSDNESWVYAGRVFASGQQVRHGYDDGVAEVRRQVSSGWVTTGRSSPASTCRRTRPRRLRSGKTCVAGFLWNNGVKLANELDTSSALPHGNRPRRPEHRRLQ